MAHAGCHKLQPTPRVLRYIGAVCQTAAPCKLTFVLPCCRPAAPQVFQVSAQCVKLWKDGWFQQQGEPGGTSTLRNPKVRHGGCCCFGCNYESIAVTQGPMHRGSFEACRCGQPNSRRPAFNCCHRCCNELRCGMHPGIRGWMALLDWRLECLHMNAPISTQAHLQTPRPPLCCAGAA